LIYDMLVGKPPFKNKNFKLMIREKIEKKVPVP